MTSVSQHLTGTLLKPPFSPGASPLINPTSASLQTQIHPHIPPLSQTPLAQPHSLRPSLPAVFCDGDGKLQILDEGDVDSLAKYLELDMDVSRLNKIHPHLWLAGRPRSARPLHRQVMLSRELILTEQADLHLVWQDSRMFLKPLPDFLLDYEFWKNHLCKSRALHQSAVGFLLSYLWLISYKSDLKIAQDKGLVSLEITWNRWTAFVKSLLHHIDHDSLADVNPRYHYGELRLSRLNWIYRLHYRTWSLATLVRGYMYGYNQYSLFLQRNFAWLLVVFVYITIVLTAMQVGLATDRLSSDGRFQNASYGFTVFSILMPLIGIGLIMAILLGLFVFNLLATISFKNKVEQERQMLVNQHNAKVP